MHERASELRDELHAVANRVGRLLETPGALLAPLHIPAPTTAEGSEQISSCAFLQLAADRLAELVDALSPAQWHAQGRLGDSTITIGELVAQPLHTSHHHLHRSHLDPKGR